MATTTGSMLSVAAGSPTAAALSPSPSSVLSVPSLSSFPSTMSPTTTRTTLSWYDQLIEFVRSRQGIFAILTVVFGLITLWSCCYRRRLAQRLAAAANENTQNNEQQGVETSNSSSRIQTPADEERHIRRLKILTSIVHKKVLSRKQAAASDGRHNLVKSPHEESLLPFPFARHTSDNGRMTSNKGDNDQHKSSSIDVPTVIPVGRDGNADNSSPKDDIYLESSFRRSQAAELGNTTEIMRSTSPLYSPKSCPICLEEYRVGDEIAWSKNDQCPHAFHLDCVLDWLMDHDECPVCRGEYL